MSIESPLTEMFRLATNSIYSMDKIEWWLMKQAENFEVAFEREKFEYEGEMIYLPPIHPDLSENEKFVITYRALDELSNFYRNKSQVENELNYYSTIHDNNVQLKNWIKKIKEFGIEIAITMIATYLEDLQRKTHIGIYLTDKIEFEVFIHWKDFVPFVEFSILFNELYFGKNILELDPEEYYD